MVEYMETILILQPFYKSKSSSKSNCFKKYLYSNRIEMLLKKQPSFERKDQIWQNKRTKTNKINHFNVKKITE